MTSPLPDQQIVDTLSWSARDNHYDGDKDDGNDDGRSKKNQLEHVQSMQHYTGVIVCSSGCFQL